MFLNLENGNQVFRLRTYSSALQIADGFLVGLITVESFWTRDRWVYMYLYSDDSVPKFGFGAFAPAVGSEFF